MLTVFPVSVMSPGGLFPVNIICGATFLPVKFCRGNFFRGRGRSYTGTDTGRLSARRLWFDDGASVGRVRHIMNDEECAPPSVSPACIRARNVLTHTVRPIKLLAWSVHTAGHSWYSGQVRAASAMTSHSTAT